MTSFFQKIKLPRAVLFDYDGVLVASEPIHLLAWMQLLEELEIPKDAELIQKRIGRTAPEILTELLNLYKPGWSPTEYDVAALAQRKNSFYLPMARTQLVSYPGAKEGLQWLRENGVRAAVVSNGKRHELEKTIQHLGLFEWVDQIISRDDVPAVKPDPTPYLMAAALLDLNPEDCVAIEDSPPGLEAALMAKIPAVGVLTNFPASMLGAPVAGRPDLKPLWLASSLSDFFQWLKTL